jgi:hypothetical protein
MHSYPFRETRAAYIATKRLTILESTLVLSSPLELVDVAGEKLCIAAGFHCAIELVRDLRAQ